MNTQVSDVSDRAMALSADDRLALVTLLWDSLAQEDPKLPDDDETVVLARKRAHELDSGQVQSLSHEEVMASLLAFRWPGFPDVLNEKPRREAGVWRKTGEQEEGKLI